MQQSEINIKGNMYIALMKKLVMLVFALVLIVAVAALYILIKSEGISGQLTCDQYEKSGCYYDPFANTGCCFSVTTSEGGTYDECYLSYKYAVTAYTEALKDSQKVKGGLAWVGGLRAGPDCIH